MSILIDSKALDYIRSKNVNAVTIYIRLSGG